MDDINDITQKVNDEQEEVLLEPVAIENQVIKPKFEKTVFAQKMETVKTAILDEAETSDENFKKQVKDNLKKAAITATEVEQEKQELEKSQVVTEQKKEEKEQQQVEHGKQEDKWANKQKKREYHFNGVKAIMKCIDIDEPMNLPLLYILTFVLFIPFLLGKFWKATFGAVLTGDGSSNRPKAMKGFIWTILGLFIACLFAGAVFLFLKWQAII